jgi:hypothetical protein
MKRLSTLCILYALALVLCDRSFAQLTGTKTIPGDYATLADAIADLNTQGVGSGGVTFNVAAGYAETAPAGGFVITAQGTAANPIVFQKSGSGADPTFTAPAPQTVGNLNDAIFKLVGADYVTLDRFRMLENAANSVTTAASNDMTEWGVALLSADSTNGAQNNTIKNCTIQLKRIYQNTFGIYSNATHTSTSISTALGGTTPAVSHSGLTIHGNTIDSVNIGIIVVGPTAATAHNDGLDIGGSSAATGNTIIRYGTTGTFSSYLNVSGTVNGILVRNTKNFNISYNTIQSSNGGTTSGTLRGIYVPSFSTAPTGTFTSNINNNSISLRSAVAAGAMLGIAVESSTSTTTSTTNINNNDFNNTTHTVAASGTITFISLSGSATTGPVNTNINNNTFTNLTVNTTGSVTFISNSWPRPANGVINVNNNSIVTAFNKTGAGGTVFFYDNFGSSPSSVTETNSGNNFSNLTFTGATTISGWRSGDGTTPGSRKTVTNNTFSNIVGGSSAVTILNVTFSDNTFASNNVSGNIISNITAAAAITGITSSAQNQNFFNNTISGLSSTGAAAVTAISITGGTTQNVYKNKIYSIEANNASGTVNGILISGGTTVSVYNNLIGDLRAPVTSSTTDAIRGINITSTTTSSNINVYYNSVYISASSSGANFSTSGIFHTTSTTATTAALDMRNNVIVNTSTPNGTGVTVAYRRSSTTLTNYASTSNNNDFYAGTPGAANLIFYDGTNSDQTIAAFKTRVSPREAASFTENPPFISTSGSSPNFLHISTSTPTQLESGGQPIGGITDDYDGEVRNASTPDVGADEFAGIGLDLSPPNIAYTLLSNTSSTSNRSFTGVTITDASGVNGTPGTRPRVYYKRSTDGNVWNDNTSGTDGWKYAEASGGTSPFSFTIDYSLLNGGTGVTAGQTVQYFVVAQDLATTPNVGINSGTFAATPSSVALTSAAFPIGGTINSYTIATAFTGSYNVGTGQTYTTLTGAGGFFAAINANVVTGNVTVNIVSDLTEDGTNALNQWTEEGAGNYTITIQPSAATERLIAGAVANGMIRLDGADRVTFDGRFSGSGKYLRFRNTNTSNPTFTFLNGATNNTIRDCYVEGANTSTTSGTILFSTSTGTSGNSNNTIMNCDVRDRSDAAGVPANAIYSSGTAGAPNANNTISGCNIFNWTNAGVLVSSTGAGNGWTINPSSFYQTASRTTALTAISIQGGSGHTIIGNSIGGSAPDRSGSPLTTTSTFTGITIAAGTTSPSNIQGNVLANLNISGGSTQTFKGIQVTSGNVNVGTTTGNVIGSTSDSPGSDTVRVNYDSDIIENTGSGTVVISNNTVRHIAYYNGSNDRLLGIGSSSGTVTISNNTIRNLSSNASASTTFFLMGLRVTGGTSATVSGNTIRNLTQTNTGSGAFWVSGINVTTITSATFDRNLVTEINAVGTGTGASAPVVRGIHSTSGNATYSNNMVSVGGASGGDVIVRGIESLGTGSNKFYFNSVLVGGADGGTGTNKTYAFYRSSTATDTLRNNIFSNQRTVGTGTHFAIGNSSTTNWGATTSNYNDLIASVASTVGEWLTTAGTFANWQTNSGGDANSISYAVTFISATDLHLNAIHNGDMNLKGIPAGGITVDFDNQTRDTQAPYIGADELSTPLPVQLGSFTARINPNGSGVLLEWMTVSEINNYGFYVQRRRDNEQQWTELPGFVPGHGTTTEPQFYSYVDNTITEIGLYHYRLRQVDLDGTSHLTPAISINITSLTSVEEIAPKVFQLLQNYPNPFNPATTIKFSVENTGYTTLELYNVLGQKVATLFSDVAEAGRYYRVKVDGTTLASGMYIYRLQSGNRTDLKKMLLLK